MWPWIEGPAPMLSLAQMVNDCGATMRPKRLAAANSSSKYSGFGFCIPCAQRRTSFVPNGSLIWLPPTGLPIQRSTSDVSILDMAALLALAQASHAGRVADKRRPVAESRDEQRV